MGLVKATIEILETGANRPRGLPSTLTVQFNPTEFTRSKGAQIAEITIPGIDSPSCSSSAGRTRSSRSTCSSTPPSMG